MRLRWTHDEEDTIAKGAVYLLQKGGGHSRKSAVMEAQKRWLEPDRRKTVFTPNILRTIDKKIDTFGSVPFDQLSLKEPEAKAELQRDADQRQQDAVLEETRAVEARVKEHLRSVQPELTLAAAVATLLRELAKPVAELIENKMERVVEAAVAKHFALIVPQMKNARVGANGSGNGTDEQPAQPATPPAPRADEKQAPGNLPDKFYEPKILFLGLVAKQPQSLKQQFRHIDMRIIEPHAPRGRIEEMSKKVDFCYIMARNAPPKLKLHCQHSTVNGGVSNLCHLIIERFGTCGEDAATKRAERQAKH